MVNPRQSATFVPVTCRCGRSLRAKLDQVGTEIRCWDCHQMVVVPMPRERLHVASELGDGFFDVIRGPELVRLLIAAAVATAALMIPAAGISVAGVVLFLYALAYGHEIRRVSGSGEGPWRGWKSLLDPGSVLGALLAAAMAAGTVVPLWARHAGRGSSPHFDRAGLLIFAATWVFVPPAMLMVCGKGGAGMLGPRRSLRLMARFPLATSAALAIVPASLVLLELGLGVLFYIQGVLPFFTLEFMAMAERPVLYQGVPYFHSIDYRAFPQSRFLPIYFRGLSLGYSFVAAFPASLSLPTGAGLAASVVDLPGPIYTAGRALLTQTILTCLLASAGIQARWLGLITTLEKGRPAA